uniref:Uncharacterized protein n=1 Tax=Arundo donax TaxID=35708 RepID=A0A0A9PY55_ARUDO
MFQSKENNWQEGNNLVPCNKYYPQPEEVLS